MLNLRCLALAIPLWLASCGTFAAPPRVPSPFSAPVATALDDRADTADRTVRVDEAFAPSFAGSNATPVPGEKLLGGGSGYTMIKLGPFYGQGDLEDLDTGIWGEVVFGRELLPFLALEASLGYVSADGGSGTNDFEFWGIPLMVQARASLPIPILEPYVGVGVGGMYVDAQAGALYDTDDFVWAANAFAGVAAGIGNLAVGVEGKYLITDEVDSRFQVEGAAATLFVSLPF